MLGLELVFSCFGCLELVFLVLVGFSSVLVVFRLGCMCLCLCFRLFLQFYVFRHVLGIMCEWMHARKWEVNLIQKKNSKRSSKE